MTFEDRFQLEVPLGESPHGAVWSGKEGPNQKAVVVTLLDEDADEVSRARMKALIDGDVSSVRAMTLARVVDAGFNAEGLPYIVTERLVDAPSLADKLEAGPAVTVDIATRCVVDLLGAISKLGEAGLSHGDIEPGNVRVVARGARLSPRLIGLGLNRATIREGQHGIDSPDHLATLSYMAPEQAGESPAGTSADAFSAIAVLYSWISGRLPFRGADAAAIREAAGSLHVPRLGSVREELAGTALAAVIDKALSREPADRYADIATLMAKLRESLLQGKETRELEVVVGPRTSASDATDAELSKERATGPTPAAVRRSSSSSLKIPGPRKSPTKPDTKSAERAPLKPLPKPSKPSPPKEQPAAEASGADAAPEDERDPDEVAFEKISGLLMIEEDAPPKRVQPRRAPPPPPGSRSAAASTAEGPTDDDQAPENEPGADAEAPGDGASSEASPSAAALAPSDDAAPPDDAALAPSDDAAPPDDAALAPSDDAALAPSDDASPPDDATDALLEELEAATALDEEPAAEDAPSEAMEPPAASAEPLAAVAPLLFDDEAQATGAEPLLGSEPLSFDDSEPGDIIAPVATHAEDAYVVPGGGPPWKIIGAGAALAVVLVGVVVWASTKSHEHPALDAAETTSEDVADVETGAPPADEAPGDEPEEEVPEESEPALVTLAGVPEGATVSVDGEAIDGTDVRIENESHEVEVRADGFEPWTVTVNAETAASLAVELVPVESETEEEAEEEAEEPEDEAGETLTPAQRRRRERRRQARRERREARQRAGSTRSLIAPNPF